MIRSTEGMTEIETLRTMYEDLQSVAAKQDAEIERLKSDCVRANKLLRRAASLLLGRKREAPGFLIADIAAHLKPPASPNSASENENG